jgi:hypothetical protein
MSGNTTTEGYPYPLTSDFGDVQDVFRLATAIDVDLRAEQAPFRSFIGRPSFIARSTVTGAGFLSGGAVLAIGATDWDNTGGVGTSYWTQPTGQGPSWWMFGCTILVSIVSGTPVVGDLNQAAMQVTTVDQVTGAQTTTWFYQRNDDTNTNGEWLNMHFLAPIYHGTVRAQLNLNGSTSKSIQAGSRFWGVYLGPVV